MSDGTAEPEPSAELDAPARRRLSAAAAIFGVATGLSRLAGLVREIVTRRFFGVEGEINAFTVAFQVPNLVRALVADAALTAAFVPVFSELLEKGEKARAWRVASTVFWLLLLGLTAVTALCMLLAPLIMAPFGLPPEYDSLAVTLSRILFPIVVLLGVSGVIVGILNSYEHFTVPALAPVAWNLAIIAGLVIGVPQVESESAKLYVYAGSILVGTVIQVLLPVPWLMKLDGRLRVLIDWRDPAVKQTFVLMVPVTLGLGLINFNSVIGTFFASRYIDPTIAPSAIDAAFRIYMLPQGMFSVAVATVLFPAMSRIATRGDMPAFGRTVATGIRQIAFLLIPASVASAVLAEPIVRLLYQRGEFTPDQTPVVAGALAAFSCGLVFNGMMLMLNRAFFALQSPWIPTWVAAFNLTLNTLLYIPLYHVGTWGIPLAISLSNMAAALVLVWLLRRRLGRLDLRATIRAFILITLASIVLAGVSYGVWRGLDEALGDSFVAQLVAVCVALVAGGAAYMGACWALRVYELRPLLALMRGRQAR